MRPAKSDYERSAFMMGLNFKSIFGVQLKTMRNIQIIILITIAVIMTTNTESKTVPSYIIYGNIGNLYNFSISMKTCRYNEI